MTLVKRLLFVRVDVLDLEVHFGLETAGRPEALLGNRELTSPTMRTAPGRDVPRRAL